MKHTILYLALTLALSSCARERSNPLDANGTNYVAPADSTTLPEKAPYSPVVDSYRVIDAIDTVCIVTPLIWVHTVQIDADGYVGPFTWADTILDTTCSEE